MAKKKSQLDSFQHSCILQMWSIQSFVFTLLFKNCSEFDLQENYMYFLSGPLNTVISVDKLYMRKTCPQRRGQQAIIKNFAFFILFS